MAAMATVVDGILRITLALARRLFWLQALAFGCAATTAGLTMPVSMQSPLHSLASASVAFGLAAVAMTFANRPGFRRRMHDGALRAGPGPAWAIALAAAAAFYASFALPGFWRDVALQVEPLAIGDDLTRPGPHAGLGALLVAIAVAVPALVTVAALASIALPVAVLVLLAARYPTGGGRLAAVVACLSGLVVGANLAMAAMADVIAQALESMRVSGDIEVLAMAETLARMTTVIVAVASRLGTPLLVLSGAALYVWSLAAGRHDLA